MMLGFYIRVKVGVLFRGLGFTGRVQGLGLHFHGRTGAVVAFMHPWVSVCGINLDWDTSINAV